MCPNFCVADLFERGRLEQVVQEGHAAQNVLLGTEDKNHFLPLPHVFFFLGVLAPRFCSIHLFHFS